MPEITKQKLIISRGKHGTKYILNICKWDSFYGTEGVFPIFTQSI